MRVVKINFYQDYVDQCRAQLEDVGYKTSDLDSDSLVHAFLNLNKRMVNPSPRAVIKAKNFSCPDEHAEGLKEVERKIGCGENLFTHLSRKIEKLKFNDGMLNDWGIHHLHLGKQKKSSRFSDRGKYTLFVKFDQENAYLLGVYDHDSWSKQELIRIIHDNWPETIKKYRLNNVVRLERPIDDSEIAECRNFGISTMVDLGGGVVYAMLGGGYTTSGLSLEVLRSADFLRQKLRNFQEGILENFQSIRNQARNAGFEIPRFPEIKLIFSGEKIFAYESISKYLIPLGVL
jgi:hypothetical protein